MKPKDIFCIAVRLLGLVFLYHGLMAAPAAVAIFFSGLKEYGEGKNVLLGPLMVAWPLFVAWWLVRGAPLLVKIAFPEDRPPASPAPAN